MSTQKRQSTTAVKKSLNNKIHRRKNQQIEKKNKCPEGCGKAYGSYAALYTHMKNKHLGTEIPQMNQHMVKIVNKGKGKKGRPVVVNEQSAAVGLDSGEDINSDDKSLPDCKLCAQQDCLCVEDYTTEDRKKTIKIMSNQEFVSFVNQIGNLSIQDKIIWVRSTQQNFNFYEELQIIKMIKQFNQDQENDSSADNNLDVGISLNISGSQLPSNFKNSNSNDNLFAKHQTENVSMISVAERQKSVVQLKRNQQLKPSTQLIQFLSFSSRYWDALHINQLYKALFIMRVKEGRKQIIEAFQSKPKQFQNILACAQMKKEEFEELCNLIKVI